MNMRTPFLPYTLSLSESVKNAFSQLTRFASSNKTALAALPKRSTTAQTTQKECHPLPSIPNIKVSHPTAAALDADAAMQTGAALGQMATGMQQFSAPGYLQYLQTSMQLLKDHPVAGLLNQTQPLGLTNFAVATGISVVGVPCTIATFISALRDITEANQLESILDIYQKHYQQQLAALAQQLAGTTDANQRAILTRHHIQITQLDVAVQFVKRLNHLDKKGNQFTLVSATSTLASATLTTGAQAGLVALNHSPTSFAAASVETAAGIAAASASAVGAVLALPAGIGSAGYGWYMMQKAEQQRRFFKQTYKKLIPMLKVREIEMSRQASAQIETEAAYLHFVRTKLQQRRVFLRWFSRFSKGLLTGGMTSSATALVKGAAVAATIAGASVALTNPVVPLLLIVLGAVGLGITALSSQQVFYRHTKHKRYDRQRILDDAELDRTWLSHIDIWHDDYSKKGFTLRAHFYQMLNQREKKRQEWLTHIATRPKQPHYFKPILYSTDIPRIPTSTSGFTSTLLTTKIAAQLRSSGLQQAAAWTHSLVQNLSVREAKAAYDQARKAPGTRLNTEAIATWLAEPSHQPCKIQYMRSFIKDQKAFMQNKLKSRAETYEQRLATPPQRNLTDSANPLSTIATTPSESFATLRDLLQEFDVGYQQDQRFREELESLDDDLAQLEKQPETDIHGVTRLPQLQARFIELQHGRIWHATTGNISAGSNYKLAQYLLHEAPLRARELRGVLLETEMDAASIRYQTYGTEGDLRQKQAQLFESKLKKQTLAQH